MKTLLAFLFAFLVAGGYAVAGSIEESPSGFSYQLSQNQSWAGDAGFGNNVTIAGDAGILGNVTMGGGCLTVGPTIGTACALNTGTNQTIVLGTNGTLNATQGFTNVGTTQVSGHLLLTSTAPTISSGFGTGASISANNGTPVFLINVGTGGTANSGVIGLPTATTGWVVLCNDMTTFSTTVFTTRQTASSTTSATIGNFNTSAAAAAWAASDVLRCIALAY